MAMPATSGELLVTCDLPEGPRYLAMFTWADGHVQSNENALSFGRALGLLHDAADGFPMGPLRDLALEEAIEMGGDYLGGFVGDNEERAQLQDVLGRIEHQFRTVLSRIPDMGPCHGDAHAGNANIDRDGRVTFFDFDFCCTAPRCFDLATFRWSNELDGTHDETRWTQFLTGYRSVRDLPDVEVDNALLLRPARHLWWLCFWRTHQNSLGVSRFLRDDWVSSGIHRLSEWTDSSGG